MPVHVEVAPRKVSPPWWREAVQGARPTHVGLEDYVEPEPGPVEEYRATFPERRITWDRRRQLFVIRDVDDPSFRRFVFRYDAPPDESTPEVPRTEEELLKLEASRSGELRKCFIPFDYQYVRKAIRELYEQETLGPAGFVNKIADKNRKLEQSRIRQVASESAAAWHEVRRWWRVLAGEAHDPVPLIPGGFTP